MLVFEDAIVISLRPVSVSFAMRLRSRPGQLHHRPARPGRDESIRIGLRTLILTLPGVLTIAALLRRFGTPRPASERCAMPDLTSTDRAREIRRLWLDVPIILMSGYGGTQLTARAAANGVDEVLRKALQGRDLAESLASVQESAREMSELERLGSPFQPARIPTVQLR
jgi:DNA-binding NarL/FixJ family response regulator